ncbi:hypothetical protein QJS10_CPA08g00154 [Acorus calamus]|uniref:Uncharacterized protein n=1 Tax=Acorus calamus TaxID=4465 RepID=A0AAV9EDS0_ACOCL|nr:hypothetical protein QJS10_CPA08g00154 [Acorus calamus]
MHRLPSTVSSGPSILPRLVAARAIPSVLLFPSARCGNLTSLPRFSSSLSSTGESATDDNIGDSSKHAKLCISENFPVVPVPGPSALIAALSASGLSTDEFTFVGFLPKQDGSRKDRMMVSSNETATQSFYVAPHNSVSSLKKLLQFMVIRVLARPLGEAKEVFSTRQPKGEITLLIEGKAHSVIEMPSEVQLEHELRELVSSGHSLSMAVKMVAEGTAAKRKQVYALALRIFGKDGSS